MDEHQACAASGPQAPPSAGRVGMGWVLGLFFVSGFSGLMYEIIWVHKLALIFGNTALAVSTVLAAFMAGLGFGSLWFGRLVEGRHGRALLWYVWLEVGIGLFALVSLPMLDAFEGLYVWLYRTFGATWYLMSLVRLACAFVTLLPATLLMGGTLPVLCRYFVRDEAGLQPAVAKLYGVNALGAMLGCFAASFLLVGTLGVHRTLWLGAVLNFVAAAGVWLVARGVRELQPRPESGEAPAALAEGKASDYPHWSSRKFLVLVALCGFCGLSYESFWTRLLSHVIGLHVQAFGLMLLTFLLGIGLGSMVVARSVAARERPLALFIVVEVLIGCFALLTVPLFSNIGYFSWLGASVVGSRSLMARMVVRFFQCVVIMIVPALLMGAAFPLAVRLYASGPQRVGRDVGAVYAWNTFGAILGSLAAGFVMMPLLGTNVSVIAVALLNVLIGAALLRSCPELYRAGKGRAVLAVLALSMVATFVSAAQASTRPAVFSRQSDDELNVLWHKEDIAGSVCVLESKRDRSKREVNINGLSVAYTSHSDVRVQKLLAHLPILLHRSPKDVLVVGFGSGSTSGTTMLYPVQTECVELQRLEMSTAKYFVDLNRGVLDHPRFRMHINDGRNFLLMSEKSYDVISRDTLPPKESQDLFSVEFYDLCKARVRPGGVVCGFLPTDLCPMAAYFKLLVRSFLEAFPDASLWYVGPSCCLLLGPRDKLQIDYARLVERMSEPEVKRDLQKIHMDDPAVFLSHFIAAGDRLRAFVGQGPVATDDKPLGFGLDDWYISFSEADRLVEDLLTAREPISHYLVNVGASAQDRQAVLERLSRAQQAGALTIRGKHLAWVGNLGAASELLRQAMEAFPDDMDARYSAAWTAWQASQRLAEQGHLRRAIAAASGALELYPELAEPHAFLGQAYEVTGDRAKAIAEYRKACQLNPGLVLPTAALERLRGPQPPG